MSHSANIRKRRGDEGIIDLQEHIEEAVEWLRKVIGDREVLVGFSGGKDSIVTAQLVQMAQLNHKLIYSNTTIDPPAILKFIKEHYPHCIWVRPKRGFFKLIGPKNPPLKYARWCCVELKERPTWKIPIYDRIFGIRAEESVRRTKYPRINYFEKNREGRPKHTQYYPILNWPEWVVWEFIEHYELAYPKLYEKFDRLGCVVCPMRREKQHEQWRKVYPNYYKAFEKAVAEWYKKRVSQGRTMAYSSPKKFCKAWYTSDVSWYAKEYIE
jgi:phosphoadenosine phosphosulfate reductase